MKFFKRKNKKPKLSLIDNTVLSEDQKYSLTSEANMRVNTAAMKIRGRGREEELKFLMFMFMHQSAFVLRQFYGKKYLDEQIEKLKDEIRKEKGD